MDRSEKHQEEQKKKKVGNKHDLQYNNIYLDLEYIPSLSVSTKTEHTQQSHSQVYAQQKCVRVCVQRYICDYICTL